MVCSRFQKQTGVAGEWAEGQHQTLTNSRRNTAEGSTEGVADTDLERSGLHHDFRSPVAGGSGEVL
jgi:hypothetical protein